MRQRALSPPRDARGITLIEMLAAAMILSMLAGGTLMGFATASRISTQTSGRTEAGYLAQQTLEKYRNRVACALTSGEASSKTAWYDDIACAPNVPPGTQVEGIPATTPPSTASSRKYWVSPVDCDGVGGAGDCLEVRVEVQY